MHSYTKIILESNEKNIEKMNNKYLRAFKIIIGIP